jgi:hypothetical protein
VYQDSCANPKVAVVVIGEKGYTHGTEWADKNPNIPADQLAIIQKFHDKGVKVITVILSPRPHVLTPLMDISDAVMLVYRGGTGIGQATAALIFGDYAPSGRLPFQLPKSDAQLGTDNLNNMVEKWELPYDIGATDAERIRIRSYIKQGLAVPPIFGDPLFQYGFGMQGFNNEASALDPVKSTLGLKVYPNPVKDKVLFDFGKELDSYKIRLQDISGRTVLEKAGSGEFLTLDMSSSQSGVYLITIDSEGIVFNTKLIKK